MNPELIDRIEDALEPLAEAASQGAEYAWGTLARQAIIQGAALAFAGVVALIVTVICLVYLRRTYQRWEILAEKGGHSFEDNRAREAAVIAIVALSVGALACLASTLLLLAQGILRLINPGYYALEYLARVVGT